MKKLKQIIREEIQRTDIMRIMKSAFEATKKNKDNIALNYFKKEFRKLESIDSSQWSEYIEDILGDYGYEVDFKTLKVTGTKSELKEQDDPSFIPYVGSIDTWNLKNMYIKNRTADGILTNAEKEFMKKPDVVVITANRFNTIWTDGKQEFEINTKTNKLVKPLRKARKEIVNHFKNLKYRWKGDTLIFEAKWRDFKHTKGFVHIPLGIKTDSSNSDRKKITVLTNLELNKNKSFQKSFHDFSIYIKEGSLWMMISPAGKRDIREKMKENKNYLRELIDRIKEIIKKNKHIQESKFNHNAAEAFGAYMRGEISVEEVTKIAKQTGKQVATKAELNGFLKNKFMQELMADTYNTPKNLLVKRVKALLQVAESLNEANEGDRFVHKYSPEIEIELIEPTNRGWKVKQTTGRKSKTAFFDKQDIVGGKAIFKPIKESILRKIIREEIQSINERVDENDLVKIFGWYGLKDKYPQDYMDKIKDEYGEDGLKSVLETAQRLRKFEKRLVTELRKLVNTEEFKMLQEIANDSARYSGMHGWISTGSVLGSYINKKR